MKKTVAGQTGESVLAWLRQAGLKFCLLFALWVAVMAVGFELFRPQLVALYMHPVSRGAALLLEAIGLQVRLSMLPSAAGVCELALDQVVYLVTFECTGIFALGLCLASVLAYPASPASKLKGVAVVLPAFAAYGTLRLATMGLVAHFLPSRIELFHLYVMVVVNLGFVFFLWSYWVHEVVGLGDRNRG